MAGKNTETAAGVNSGVLIYEVDRALGSRVPPLLTCPNQATPQLLGVRASGVEGRPVLWRFPAGVLVQLNQPN